MTKTRLRWVLVAALLLLLVIVGRIAFGGGRPSIRSAAMLKRVEREITRRLNDGAPVDEELAKYDTGDLVSALGVMHVLSIYTPDSRVNAGALKTVTTNPLLIRNLNGVAAIVIAGALKHHGKLWKLETTTYKKHKDLCDGQLFEQEPVGAICTAFLVGEKTLATAAHCYDDYELAETRFVFGFEGNGMQTTTTFDEDDVYEGVDLDYGADDQMLITLDRKVTQRAPLPIDARDVHRGDKLYVIGHPAGLPLKFADGARAQDVVDPMFTANLDVLGGNSGSPVFNAVSHKIVGMYLNGADGYLTIPEKNCQVLKECPSFSKCLGEGCLLAKYLH